MKTYDDPPIRNQYIVYRIDKHKNKQTLCAIMDYKEKAEQLMMTVYNRGVTWGSPVYSDQSRLNIVEGILQERE